MRRPAIVFFTIALAALSARASGCPTSADRPTQHWILHHYVYDPSLKQDWKVLIDCDHPAAPEKIELVPHGTAQLRSGNTPPYMIHAGTIVDIASPPGAPASIHLSGTATQTAFSGQSVRVRLNPSVRFVTAIVRGPHSVELTAPTKPRWGDQ